MTTSASTPRIRVTQVWYGIVLVLVALSERVGFGGPNLWVEMLGFLLMMAAALGRVWTSAHIAGYKDRALITVGPYSVCRHPLYAFSLLGGFGVGLVTQSVFITATTLLVLGALHWLSIISEEQKLLAAYGQSFQSYRQQVPSIWPSWKNYQSGGDTRLDLRVFRKAFLDAGTFVLLYAVIRILDAGRVANGWPTLFRLW